MGCITYPHRHDEVVETSAPAGTTQNIYSNTCNCNDCINRFNFELCKVWSLTMVFTEEDCVVIKFLHQNKSYSARSLVKEFMLKNWQFEQTT